MSTDNGKITRIYWLIRFIDITSS